MIDRGIAARPALPHNVPSMEDALSERAADHLARRLYDAGCRHAFGMPGGEVLTLVDALERAGIAFHLAKHENAAGFMAEGVHHHDGAPAILVATVGPGVLNAVNVTENARQDRVPLIVLSGCVDADEALTYTHQVLDQQAVFAPITKASFRLTAKGAGLIADKAIRIATMPRCGPVHIDVPIGVAAAQASGLPLPQPTPLPRTVPAPAALKTARSWLAGAERPLVVAGLDAVHDEAGPALTALCEALRAPLVTTYKAKGLMPEDHPLALGGAGLSPLADEHLLPKVREADVVLLAGYDPIEMRTGWRDPFSGSTKVIDLVAEPNRHDMHRASLEIVAHVGETLALLAEGLTPRDGPVWTGSHGLRAAFPSDDEWGPAGVIAECRAVLPRETVATVDSGAHRILLSQMWEVPEARGLLQSSGLCTMGCAVPLAIGRKLAEPARPVAAFTGDAGLLMVAGDLSTASELGVAPIIVTFVDASLALIEKKQRGMQLPNAGVDFARHDYAGLARALGGEGATVRSRPELRDALLAALDADRFTLIACEIEPGGYDGRI